LGIEDIAWAGNTLMKVFVLTRPPETSDRFIPITALHTDFRETAIGEFSFKPCQNLDFPVVALTLQYPIRAYKIYTGLFNVVQEAEPSDSVK